MKSTIINQTTPAQKFPCLGIYSDGDVILFTSSREGMVIHSISGGSHVGQYSSAWLRSWEPFSGTIELAND